MTAAAASQTPAADHDRQAIGLFDDSPYEFPKKQQALIPGGPGRPVQGVRQRALYGLVFVLLGLTGGFANSFVLVNSAQLQGALGASQTEIAWVGVAYVMGNASMNLLYVRFRQQFGLRVFIMLGLFAFCTVIFVHLFVVDIGSAVLIHGILGIAAAPLTVGTVFYALASLPQAHAPSGVILGLGLPQVATPLARMFSPELLALDQWRSLYLFEFGLALVCLGAVALIRLPPSQRMKGFEPLDFLTFALFSTGIGLLAAALGLGRLEWWTDKSWIGWALAGCLPLLGAALLIELNRAKPLIDVRFLTTPAMIRFVLVVLIGRLVLAEQGTLIYTLLTTLSVTNDELQHFSMLLTVAAVAGMATAAIVYNPKRGDALYLLGVVLVAVAAFIDSHSTNLTRPVELYATQMTIAFAVSFFIGPALLKGLGPVLALKGEPFIGYVVLFAILQAVGSLGAGSLLGTFQARRETANYDNIAGSITATDPLVIARLAASAASTAPTNPDAIQAQALALQTLGSSATLEANVLAYNNTFMLVAVLAALTAIYLAIELVVQRKKAAPAPAPAPAPTEKPA